MMLDQNAVGEAAGDGSEAKAPERSMAADTESLSDLSPAGSTAAGRADRLS
jgi:hypothetical protein